jgi:predicted nucleic acid-binding protein
MIYFLDVNALLALMVQEHEFHDRALKWVRKAAGVDSSFATA